jgi:hypothetical protein
MTKDVFLPWFLWSLNNLKTELMLYEDEDDLWMQKGDICVYLYILI